MPPKRKRNEKGPGDGGPGRPSPHRPGDTFLGQHDRGYTDNNRGGRSGRSTRRSERRDSSQSYHPAPTQVPSTNTSRPVSPTLVRPTSASSQATPAPPAQPLARPPVPSRYAYTVVTDDRVQRWAKDGRKEVVDYGVQVRDGEDVTELSVMFQELIRSVTDSRISATDAGIIIKELVGSGSGSDPAEGEADLFQFDPRTLFLDTISIDIESGEYQPRLRELMMATEIPPLLMRQVLDPPLLEKMGLIRNTFSRVGIRLSTNLLYRQANYNLLREESEGYSKLTTELFTTSSTEPPSSDTVQATFERIKALIGTFDLDVGRVLDVTLDVFAAVLIKQFRFFIKFLRVSSWWPRSQIQHAATAPCAGGLPHWALPESYSWMPNEEDEALTSEQRVQRDVAFWDRAREVHLDAFFELGGRRAVQPDDTDEAATSDGDQDVDAGQNWTRVTKTLPPPGNRVAAQLLGFKLRFYTSDARDAEDVLPANLLYLAALLIKVGFISLPDLWPHLWPLDEDMENVRAARMKELEEKERASRPGGSTNALMMAGALPDDMPAISGLAATAAATRHNVGANKTDADSKAAKDAESKPKLPEPDDQKVHLLKCLLTIGAIPESLFILGRYDWLPEAYPELLPLIHRILHHSVDKVYGLSRPVASSPSHAAECPAKDMPDIDQTGVPKGSVKLGPLPAKRALRWPYPDKADTYEGSAYRFYWDEWADNVPVCQTVDDIFTLCGTFLNLSGVNIGKDSALLNKLASIGSKSLAEDQSPDNLARWQGLLRRLLVPALSLTEANPSVVAAVWDILKQYPTPVRFTIYAEWYEGQISRLPSIRKAFARTRLETLSTMKRLSLTNISQMARTLAKTAYASPGVVFKVALDQIEAYSNLIEAFVECAKYFTELGYDVLVWSLMSSLGGKERSRTQETSVLLTSKWLQALSRFSGKVFKRYAVMDPTPVIQYVNEQLYKGNSTDLVILKELISSMGGVVSDADFTDAQLRAMTGGEILRRETLRNLGDKREDSARSASRMMRALVDTKLAGQLLVNIAQYRQAAIYKVPEAEAHIKFLATMVDDTHQVLVQYLDLLRSNLKPDKFDSLVPDVVQLMKEYGLDAGLAFMIVRASLISHMMTPKSSALALTKDDPSQPEVPKLSSDPDVSLPIEPNNSLINGSAALNESTPRPIEPDATDDDKMMVDGENSTPTDASAPPLQVNGRRDPFLDALQPVIDAMPDLVPSPEVWKRMSPEFYVVFWSLQLGDLALPQSSYEAEHAKLRKQAEDVMKDRSDMTRNGMNKKDQRKRELLDKAELIHEENKRHLERYHKTKIRLARESSTWFPGDMTKVRGSSDTILEQCVLPRLHLSAVDAEYCFRMVKFLHESQASNFKLVSLYDRFFNQNRLRSIIFTCTVREAEHLGRFLKCVLGDLSRWHGDKDAYEKEALGMREKAGKKVRTYLGFATAFDAEGKPTTFIEHDPFRDLLFRWHRNLNTALRTCLGGMEWMHIRNAITILKTVIDFFPAITFMADKFLEQLKTITEREAASKAASEVEEGHRVDLSVTAQTAFSELQKRKSKWILVQAFRPGTTGESKDESKQQQQQQQQTAPAANTSLRASAPEFKPNQIEQKKTAAEEEDGEVKDNKNGNKTQAPKPVPNNEEKKEPELTSKAPPPPNEQPKDAASSAATRSNSASSKPLTPTPKPPSTAPTATPPIRPETPNNNNNRTSSIPNNGGGHGLPARPDLPSRPDVPFPSRMPVDRFGNQLRTHDRREPIPTREAPNREPRETREQREPPSRDTREPRESRDTRDTHPPEPLRTERSDRPERQDRPDRPPERSQGPAGPRSSDQRGPELPSRDPSRPPERDRSSRPEPTRRTEQHAARDRDNAASRDSRAGAPGRQDVRPARDSPHTSNSPHANASTTSRPLESRDAPADGGRQRLPQVDRPEIINPERAALIDGSREPLPRPSNDRGRERNSRPLSPRKSDHFGQPEPSRDERSGRHRHSDHYGPARDSPRDGAPPRLSDRESDRAAERPKEAPPSHGGPPPRQGDSDPSRSGHQDPNYGRLNPIQSVADIPSGPRGRGRNSSRISSMNGPASLPPPPPRADGRFGPHDSNRPQSPDRHPPTGPSSSRSRRSQYESSNVSLNPPVSAPTPPPPAGIHPDRLRQINPSMPAPPDVHTDRGGRPSNLPPPSGPPPHSRPSLPPLGTPDRPPLSAGPPGSRPSPSSLPSTPRTDLPTPTGPSSTNDRMRPGGNRQLRGIQSTLNQAQADMPGSGGRASGNIRGRVSSRSNLANSDAQVLTGSSPVSTPNHERHESSRRDSNVADRSGRHTEPIQTVSDSREGRGGDEYNGSFSRSEHERGSSRREHRDRSDRSGRPSRRSSRERSIDRERDRDRDRDSRELRDRRPGASGLGGSSGAARENEREQGPSRRSMRDPSGTSNRDNRDSFSGSGRDTRSHRGDGPGGRDGGSGRGGGRESRSERDSARDDRGRKRRSEDASGSIGNEREKRQRR